MKHTFIKLVLFIAIGCTINTPPKVIHVKSGTSPKKLAQIAHACQQVYKHKYCICIVKADR